MGAQDTLRCRPAAADQEQIVTAQRKIAVFTGNRAEYGLQLPILKAIKRHPDLECQLIVSGAHLDPYFGRTLAEITKDGFDVAAQVQIDVPDDTIRSTPYAIGSGVLAITQSLANLRPDLMVVYADRFEGFAAIIAATQMGIPTAHLEGGDVTEGGALDDSVRHAMTKLAHLHFTTNLQATNRLLAMGEEPWRVQTVGFPMIDLIVEGNFSSRADVQQRFKFDLTRPIVLFTQHSVTTEAECSVTQIGASLAALERLAKEGIQVLATYPNNDAGGRRIVVELKKFAGAGVPNFQLYPSLGRRDYHGILALTLDPKIRIACVGNSSSGIKETPAFGCPTVNIGSRQLGRLRAKNVIDSGYDVNAIYAATQRCLFDEEFRAACRNCENPYGKGNVGPQVADTLARVPLDGRLLHKRMTLLGETHDGWYR